MESEDVTGIWYKTNHSNLDRGGAGISYIKRNFIHAPFQGHHTRVTLCEDGEDVFRHTAWELDDVPEKTLAEYSAAEKCEAALTKSIAARA